jgi:hypothetical protein
MKTKTSKKRFALMTVKNKYYKNVLKQILYILKNEGLTELHAKLLIYHYNGYMFKSKKI